MKAIIVGAGQVGTTLAEHLAKEKHDVSIIDTSIERLLPLQERLDIQTITGNGAHPSTLSQAGADSADLLIAVSSQDEVNMIACQISFTLFKIPKKIARIRSLSYLAHKELFSPYAIPIDVLISPEQVITNHIRRLIERPDALHILDFGNEKLQIISTRILPKAPFLDKKLKQLTQLENNCYIKVIAVVRKDKAVVLGEHEINLEAFDEIIFLAAKNKVSEVMKCLGHKDNPNKKVIIGGGGNIGTRLALGLEQEHQVKVIDNNITKADNLAKYANKAIILQGNCTDKDLLLQEGIEHTDIYCAVTFSDEANVISCMLAKRLGAKKVMSLINSTAYLDIIRGSDVDIAISTQHATIASLLTHIYGGNIINVHTLRRGIAEAMESIVSGDESNSKIIGKKVKEINIPKEIMLGAIVRENEIILNVDNVVIQKEDHIIWIVYNKKRFPELEQLLRLKES